MSTHSIIMNSVPSTPLPSALTAPMSSSVSFDSELIRAKQGGDLEAIREAVEQLIASSLVLPVLATVRESNMSTGPFAPGAAERRFGPLLDQHFADRVTKGSNFQLVDAIVDRLARTYGVTTSSLTGVNLEIENA